MKKFILTILTVFAISALILFVWTYLSTPKLDEIDFSVSKDKHIAVLGPSTTGCAIDDSRIPGYVNISLEGAPYDVLISYLPLFLKSNPQIDTVLISSGRFLVVSQRDQDNGDGATFSDLWPGWFMKFKPFVDHLAEDNPQIRKELFRNKNYCMSLLLPHQRFGLFQKDLNSLESLDLGYTNIKDRQRLFTDEDWSIKSYDQARDSRPEKAYYSSEDFAENYQSVVAKLNKLRSLCVQNGAVPVFIYTPLYQFERWVKWDGLYDYLSQCDSTLLIADYENFAFPDDSYYGDVQHLNEAGSQYFSDHIARYGLNVQTLGQWLKDHQ